ncbi:MAG: MFS transporter [Verrucomicrobia bacterium]|nr:MFS transporter [Verrucomicrobiota bacterium]
MSPPDSHHPLSSSRERATLVTLAAVQFTHILDFMIIMPLGAQLMTVFQISPSQFTHLVAAYGFSAAVSGFAGGFILDRFDRKRALIVLYAGFGLATLGCALAPSHHAFLLARIAAGAFGGLAGSLVNAMVGDIIPPARRGRAMGLVMVSFPVASVVGVPLGLVLAAKLGWHAAFAFLFLCAVGVLAVAAAALPHLSTAQRDHQPLRQMRGILTPTVHQRALALGAVLVMAGGLVIPFIAPSLVANVGLNEESELPLTYVIGGLATVVSTPVVGWLSDRIDRLKLLAYLSAFAVIVVLAITHLGPASVTVASVMMALFMVTMSGRFAPAMTMITNAVESRYRGGFMSVNAALQQASSATANLVAGWYITRTPDGRLLGLPLLGYIAIGFFCLTVLLAAELRAVTPTPPSATTSVPPPDAARGRSAE